MNLNQFNSSGEDEQESESERIDGSVGWGQGAAEGSAG